jgi:hypothetical protein
MALGYAGEAQGVNLMEQGVCHVVQGRSLSQRAAYARRMGAASFLLLAAVVACAMVMGSGPAGKKLAESRLYSATGWASLYGGSGSGKSAGDGWGDDSGSDDTGARNTGLHESDDDTAEIFGNSDSDPDSSKNDVHWNAAGGDSTTKTATSDDSDDDDVSSSSGTSQEKATSSGSGSTSTKQKKAEAKAKKAKGGKKSTTDHLLDLSKSFDKGLPKPKSRAEEKQQKAEQLANLLRIQKELTSDYKKVMAKGNSIKNVGKKMGLMKAKTAQHAELNGDPFSV